MTNDFDRDWKNIGTPANKIKPAVGLESDQDDATNHFEALVKNALISAAWWGFA